MKMFNDTRIYFWASVVTLSISVILAAVSFYSILHIEKKAVQLLIEGNDYYVSSTSAKSDDEKKALALKYSDKFKEAYILLRAPEVFARYENFDHYENRGEMLKKVISYFDTLIAQNGQISLQDEIYIESLLERRKLGSRLGRNTAFFFLFLSLLGWGFWFYEKKSMKKGSGLSVREALMSKTKYRIDETGEHILQILEKDARTSHEDISRQLDVPADKVKEYISVFERDHIIVRYGAHINWERIRSSEVRALIEVKISPEHGVGFDSIAENIYRFDEVRNCILISGGFDLLVQVEGDSLQEVAMFVSEKLASIKGVVSTATHFRLKTYKDSGQIIGGDDPGSKRLPFSF